MLERSIVERIEGSKITESKSDKTWLVTHLEVIRKNVLNDLSVVRGAAVPCFPPHYDIMNVYAQLYHRFISKQIAELIDHEKLQAEDIVTMLTWLEEYEGPDCLGHPNVMIDIKDLGAPLLGEETIKKLVVRFFGLSYSRDVNVSVVHWQQFDWLIDWLIDWWLYWWMDGLIDWLLT